MVAGHTYLLLTKFEGYTVNYGLRFSPSIYDPSAKCAGHKSKRKTVWTKKTSLVKYLISLYLGIECAGIGASPKFNLVGHSVEYGLQNWPVTVRVLSIVREKINARTLPDLNTNLVEISDSSDKRGQGTHLLDCYWP